MEINLKTIIKRLIVSFYRFNKWFALKAKIWSIQLNPNIDMDKSVRIKHTTIIEICSGGKIKIGKNTELLEDVKILSYGGCVQIGEYCSINAGTIIYGVSKAIIGNNVLIAGGCMIIPTNHKFEKLEMNIRDQGLDSKPIIIEDDVWIGHGCSILSGVTIGKGSVIAAGSVVNKNVESYSVAAGIPAKIIKKRV